MKSILSSLLAAFSIASAADTPNVVFIFADDLGYGDLGCYGATHFKTPHIDSLARNGKKPIPPTPTFPEEALRKSPNRFGGALKAHEIYDDEKTGTLLIEKATTWITANKEKPFFLSFPVPHIHHPFTPGNRFKGTSQCGLYGDFIHELDWMVGEILKSLEENGLNILPALLDEPKEPLRSELVIAPFRASNLVYRKDDWVYIGARGSGGFGGGKPNVHAWGGPPAIHFAGSENSDIENGKYRKDAPTAQLYNLAEDFSQTKNVIRDHPEVAKEMKEALTQYQSKSSRPARKKKQATAPKQRPPAPANAPNVIFMLTDDLGYSDISCYGAKKVKTPHIDRLAEKGIKFTDFHSAASICSPSRAAFLTGAYPQRAGLYMGINPNRTAHWFLGLHPDEITLAEQFQTKGYATHMVGKWHLGTEPEFLPRKQGFETYYGMPCNASHSPKFFDGDELVFEQTPLARLTELYTERVVNIIKESSERKEPFFLYYAHNYPHTPYQASARFKGSSKGGVRGDIMQEMDWGVGEMMKALEEAGVADNTIVVFTSDNGPTKNEFALPYRGTKYVSFEGGHRVPFIVHWPKTISEGKESDLNIHAMDLFPTISEIINASLPKDRHYDGVSLLPVLKGEPLKRTNDEPFYYYNCENLQAVRMGEWKLHLPRTKEQVPFWDKNKVFFGIQDPVLYNLRYDHAESNDVAAANPEVVKQLLDLAQSTREELGEFMQRGKAQRPTGSLFPKVPVISHEKDWGSINPEVDKAIVSERAKRHPGFKKPKRKRK